MTDQESQFSWADLYSQHLDEWNKRLAGALSASGLESIVIFAGDEKTQFRDDQTYPFAVEAYFKAWVPLTNHPGSALKLVPGQKPLLILLHEQGFWHDTAVEPTGFWVEHFEIREATSSAAVLKELGAVNSDMSIIAAQATANNHSSLLNDETLLNYLDYFRAFKTDYEANCIRYANEIAARGHVAAQHVFREGASEFEIHHAYCLATEQIDSDLPYPNIVAINEHAATLHHQNLQREIPDKIHSFLLDAGARYRGYASDVTRTYAQNEPLFESLIGSMDTLQQTLCTEALSGTDFIELNERAHQLLAKILTEHQILNCSDDEAYSTGITRTFLPHGLGHLLGLHVHDAGGHLVNADGKTRNPPTNHPMLRLTRVLEPGFVVTIEPGLYFIPSLLYKLRNTALGRSIDWDKLSELYSCGGIRVEDNVLVTNTTPQNISRPALKAAGL